MTERSFVERIVAILGVVVGTVVWVVRFLLSLLRDAAGKATGQGEPAATGSGTDQDSGDGIGERASSIAHDLRSKGETLKEEAASLGQSVAATARDKMEQARETADDLLHRDSAGFAGDGDGPDMSGVGQTLETTREPSPELTSVQHEDVGGIPEAPAFGSIRGNQAAVDDGGASSAIDDGLESGSGQLREGIPNLEEPGGGIDDAYGNQAGVSLDDQTPDGGYAGQVMQDSDLGQDRGDEYTGLAEGEEILPVSGYDRSWVKDHLDEGEDETEPEDDDIDTVPAASRGWQEPGTDEVDIDELVEDAGSTLTTDEIDYENDEVDEDDDDGMHIVDSPDEPFVEDDSAAQALGMTDELGDPVFDTSVGSQPSIDADSFAADALGNRLGGDAASGDLGPEQSPDDANWDPGASAPDYDVMGARTGSGVDEFASDEVASDMLEDIGATESETSGSGTSEEDSGDDSGSIAWATSAGVIDPDLAKPLSSEELQASSDEASGTDVADEAGEPGVTEEDAGWRDAASEVVDDLSGEMGESGTSGTTMSGPGQSAGAMTSDDAVAEDEGADEMTSNTGSFATGGTTAPEAGGDEDEVVSGQGDSGAPEGSGNTTGFNEVLPDQAYEESVGYESLQADKKSPRGSESQAVGSTPVDTGAGPRSERSSGRKAGKVPEGAIRGDGSGSCPADYPIKGNANSRIYHRPTDSSYESTIPEFCFATEADAKAAGFRARKS